MDLREILCGGYGFNSSDSGQRLVAGSCGKSDEPYGFIKRGNFLTSLVYY
jgi:hypothetical protein